MNWKNFSPKHSGLKKRTLLLGCCSWVLLTGCPQTPNPINIYPTPYSTPSDPITPTPYGYPTPESTPEPVLTPSPEPTPIPQPQRTPFPLTQLTAQLTGDYYQMQFGPGSKGLETTFGPGSKGLENLVIFVNFQQNLIRKDLPSFKTQQFSGPPLIERLRVELVRDNQLYAAATVLPALPIVTFGSRIHPGRYSVFTLIESKNTSPVMLSWNQIEVTETTGTKLRIDVFAGGQKPEDLDVAVLTGKLSASEAKPAQETTPIPETTPSPGASPTPSPTPSPVPSASPTP